MLVTPCSEVVWRVLATHSIRQFPLHFSSRASSRAITFQLDSTIMLGMKLTACSCRNMMDLSAPHDTICSWSCEFRKRTAVMEDEWSSNVWTKLYSCNEASMHDVSTTLRMNVITQILLCYLTTHWHFHLMTKCSQFVSILQHALLLHHCQILPQPLRHVFTYFFHLPCNKFIKLL